MDKVYVMKENEHKKKEGKMWADLQKLPLALCGPMHHTGLVLARQIAFAGSIQWKQHEAGPGSGGIAILSCHLALSSVCIRL